MTTETYTYTPELIPLALIDDNPYQPRLAYADAALDELAQAIRAEGLLQPPVGRRTSDGRVQLAFGHRRRRAFDRLAAHGPADWSAMPVVIRDLDNETMARQAWKENRDRRDLTAYEEARAIERYASEFSWSQKEIAEKLDLDRSTISNKLRLLRLPAPALALLERGELSERQAVALLPLAELPASAWPTNAFQIVYMDGRWRTTLDDVIAGAAKTNADNIREHVKSILNKLTVALDDQPWAKELWGTLSTVRCSTCKDCELRLKSTNRCPDVLCATDKRNAALRLQAAAAAEKARLPAVAIGRYGSYDDLSEVAITSLRAEAKRRGCGNLGVAVATGSAYLPRKVEGFEGCGIVCAHGEGKRCACRAATVVTKGPDSAAAQKKADKKQIKERYKEPAERAIAAAMADTPAGPAWLLLRRINGRAAQRLVGAPAPQIHAEIAVALVKEEIKYCFEYDVKLEDAKTKLTILLEAAKIARPWEEAEAEAAARAADRIRQHLAEARDLAALAIADHFLLEARAGLATVPADSPAHEKLAGEIALTQAQVSEAREQARAEEAEGERITAANLARRDAEMMVSVLRANTIPSLPTDGVPVVGFAEVVIWLDELATRVAAGTAAEQDLELLADHLELLADDETIPDGEYEAALGRLDDLADRIGGALSEAA